MESSSLKLPSHIYINKKPLQRAAALFAILAFFFVSFFWMETDTNYAAIDSLIMIACGALLLFEAVKKFRITLNNNPIMTISERGIEFGDKDYLGIGIIPWHDITGSSEIRIPGSLNMGLIKVLSVNIQIHSSYFDKIKNKSRKKKLIKFNKNNDLNSVFYIESAWLATDLILLKKAIYEMAEKAKTRSNQQMNSK